MCIFLYLVLKLPEDSMQLERAFVGTTSGQLLSIEWEDSEPRSSAVIQNLSKPIYLCDFVLIQPTKYA